MPHFSDALERAKAMVEAGIGTDIATALKIGEANPKPWLTEVVVNGTVRKLPDDAERGQG